MIKLRLLRGDATLEAVERLPGLRGLVLDRRFGVVGIDPQQSLFVIRVDSVDDIAARRKLSPEIVEAYGDVRIRATEEGRDDV
jgi:hypothetical protein